jgi:molecular chaperone DnaK
MRSTIDFGIDLGTTNSSIAVLKGIEPVIIKNNENDDITPSAVWVSRQGQIFVGRRAKNQADAAIEFKLSMGTNRTWSLGQKSLTAEELSAEVLKVLRGDAQKRLGEEITAAVIGVPANFNLAQCKATERAAISAGFTTVRLIQEPVAAALAYSFQGEFDRTFWLVYDLGGGTFDAAIISIREGVMDVVAHGGDENLGGKLIDWDIVDHLFIPALKRKYALGSLNRADKQSAERWKALLHHLKLEAEKVKIQLSRDLVTETLPEHPLGLDEKGEPIWLEMEVTREQVEAFIAPKVERTIAICRRLLEENRLSPSDIERIILVGGPTLTPLLREMVQGALGIPVMFDVDPVTIVARGAAIFAGTQKLDTSAKVVTKPSSLNILTIELVYAPIGSTTEPLVGGKISAPNKQQSFEGFTVEFIATQFPWRSGKVPVDANGAFMVTLRAEKGRQNEFIIEVRDQHGNLYTVIPDRLTYTVGQTVGRQILTHTVGIALATGDMLVAFEKGTPLPAQKTLTLRMTQDLRKGQAATMLRIPVMEGSNLKRADRNREIGALEVRGDSSKVWRDVPSGTEIQVTLEVDESRLVRVRAFVPLLEDEFDTTMHLEHIVQPLDNLRQALEAEKRRLEELREKALKLNNMEAMRRLHELEQERLIEDAEQAMSVAATEHGADIRCHDRILELRNRLDQVEEVMSWDVLALEARETLDRVRHVVNAYGDSTARNRLWTLEQQVHEALAQRQEIQLRKCVEELVHLALTVLWDQPEFCIGIFYHLTTLHAQMRDLKQAETLIQQGLYSIQQNDLDGLREVTFGLIQLLPREEQARVFSTVVRGG